MKHSEAKLQREVVAKLRGAGWLVLSIPNERALGIADAKRMQAMGLTKGAPDLIAWDNDAKAWWFELKTPRGVRSPEQVCFEGLAKELNINYRVLRRIGDIEDLVCGT